MHILIKTPVERHYKEVLQDFDEELFKELAPPGVPFKLLRFDGSKKGDEVHLQIGAGPFKQVWIALIVEDGETEEEAFFIDEGKQLPFPLAYWQHRHRVRKRPEGGSEIIDDITFRTRWRLLDPFVYPFLWLQFWYRRPIYRRVFGAVTK
jgi:ligand-binding SRPBCC domain-containing protein